MTFHANTDIRWYVGTIAVSSHAKGATFTSSCEELDTTTIASAGWTEVIAGNKSGAFDLTLMSDATDDGLDETLWSSLAVANTPQSFAIGSAVGSIGYCFKSLSTSYVPIEGNPGALAMASLSGKSSGPIARGNMLAVDTTAVTSSSTGSAVQVGAVSATKRLYAALHVVSASGTLPTLDVKVQSDNASNFPSATDRITFTQATARTSQLSSVAGAVTDDYWRVSYTVAGTNPSFLFAVIVGIG